MPRSIKAKPKFLCGTPSHPEDVPGSPSESQSRLEPCGAHLPLACPRRGGRDGESASRTYTIRL